MQIVEHSAELLWVTADPEQTIAKIARTCYKSEDRDTPESNIDLIKRLLNLKHLAMFDHASASIKFVTDRGITHELVRHRMAAFAQESTRYCNYSKNKFGNEITVVKPIQLVEETPAWNVWVKGCKDAEINYIDLIANGASPQIARAVLPTCVKTEIVMTCDFTEWMHVFKLRRSPKAHPDMQHLIGLAYNILIEQAPNIFKEIL
jgi:thymidylate synthase (FAD)